MKPEILQIAPMVPRIEAALDAAYVVHRYFAAEDRDALLAAHGPAIRAVATDGHFGIAPEVLATLPALEIVASNGVGYDAIDTAACRARGVRVTNTPDVLNDAVAELAIGLMLALCRRIPQGDAHVRAGRWPEGGIGLTAELTGAHAGILGLGRIGKEIAHRLQAMRMRVSYHGRNAQPYQPYAFYPDLARMARDVDWLVVIAPGSAATRGIVSRAVLEALGPSGALVNVARGSLVDEPAMVELLADGRLGGAALDVFADEPRVPEALFALPNVVLSPHQGSATEKTRRGDGRSLPAQPRRPLRRRPAPHPDRLTRRRTGAASVSAWHRPGIHTGMKPIEQTGAPPTGGENPSSAAVSPLPAEGGRKGGRPPSAGRAGALAAPRGRRSSPARRLRHALLAGYPRPTNGIFVAMIVIVCMFTSSGSSAICTTALAT